MLKRAIVLKVWLFRFQECEHAYAIMLFKHVLRAKSWKACYYTIKCNYDKSNSWIAHDFVYNSAQISSHDPRIIDMLMIYATI